MPKRIRNIVVGVASVQRPDPVLLPALRLARRLDATLHVVHAFLLADPLLEAYARLGYLGTRTLEGYGRDFQKALETQVAALDAGARVQVRAVAGSAAPVLVEVADEVEADLIVTGGTRRGAIARTLMGATAQQVLRGSHTPVLMLRGELERVERVLLTTDLSRSSAQVLEIGIGIGGALAARPLAQKVLFVVANTLAPLTIDQDVMHDVAGREFRGFLEENGLAERAEECLRSGDPAREIAAEAEEWGADLVVLGTHGRRGASRLLLGSVAETALRSTEASVLVVPSSVHVAREEQEVGAAAATV
jgi:universal stress protein E